MNISKHIQKICNKKIAALVSSMLTFSISMGQVSAADVVVNINLEETIQRAFENNRIIKESIAERENAYWSLSTARRQSNPQINWQWNLNRVGGENIYTTHRNNFSHSLGANIPIYQGGKLKEGRRAAQFALNAADLSLENTMQAVRFQTTSYYFDVLQKRNLIDVYKEEVLTLQEHLRNVEAQFKVGTVAKIDVLESEVQLANAMQSLVNIKNQYDVAVAQLNNYIGLPADTVIQPQDTLNYNKYDFKLGNCTEFALKNRADVAVADYNVKRAESSRNATKSGYRPSLTASISKSLTTRKALGDKNGAQWTAGLTASWNIFDGGVTFSELKAADAEVIRLKEVAAQTREQTQLEVQSAFLQLKAAEGNIATTQTSVSLAEENYKIAQVRYAAGVGTNLDVMDASEKLTSARSNYFTALYNYNTAKASLDKAMGVPVEIDVTRYVSAAEKGKSAKKSRQDAALTSEVATVPKTESVSPVVMIDFENPSPPPSESVVKEKVKNNE